MTREEASKIIKDGLEDMSLDFADEEQYEALTMAIKALQEPSGDAVSRQAVDELSKALVHTTRDKADFLCNFWEELRKLPPVKQERTGHWTTVEMTQDGCRYTVTYCSECDEDVDYRTDYCPNCGARMERSDKE